jgi:hypothetical protein
LGENANEGKAVEDAVTQFTARIRLLEKAVKNGELDIKKDVLKLEEADELEEKGIWINGLNSLKKSRQEKVP